MNLTIKKKNELLNYAIERINQYDSVLNLIDADISMVGILMPTCRGCELTGYKPFETSRNCSICPFSINKRSTSHCRPVGQLYKTPRKHQDDLIKAVNNWCNKFYPEYEVVRV